jgi:NADPH:quinone reductase-like Zn-dependent oxidoreductase
MKTYKYTNYGDEDQLHIVETSTPEIEANEVLVRVKATSVNSYDWDMLRGKPWYVKAINGWKKPKVQVLGCDFSGEVEKVGPKVKGYREGDRVFGDVSAASWGGFGEYLAAPISQIAKIPNGMSFEEAAATPQASVLSLQALDLKTDAKNILMIGAGGGMGSFLIPLAIDRGARVIGVDKAEKEEFIRSIGAADFISSDIPATEWIGEYDMIVDVVGHIKSKHYKHLLTEKGHYIMVGGSPGNLFHTLGKTLFLNPFSTKKFKILGHKPNGRDVARLAEFWEKGIFKVHIDQTYPFEDLPKAMAQFGSGQFTGKIVVSVNKE